MRSFAPLCVELHDVAPATWLSCARVLAMIDALGDIPVSLLVVPHFHRRGHVTRDPAFMRAIDARVARGDEIALHGFEHVDQGPVARSPREWIRRRVRTLSEGEFAATDGTVTAERVAAGLAELITAGWQVHGFVPPAWLLGAKARAAIERFPFAYLALRNGFVRLEPRGFVPTTTLSYAAFSTWRRALSRPVLDLQARSAAARRPLRLAIHPVDAVYPAVLAHWQRLLARALKHRVAMTAAAIVARAGESGSPEARQLAGRASRRAATGVASRP